MMDSAQRYRQKIDSIYWYGERTGMEYEFYTRYKDTFDSLTPQFVTIWAGKYRRETIWRSRLKNMRDIFIFPIGILQSLYYLMRYRIDVVFCKGGYVSLPVVIAAWILRKKILVHDSDTKPGLTTRLASRFATTNFSWFPDTLPHSICIGQILSDQLLDFVPPLPDDKIHILVAGWSLGAQKLYRGVLNAVKWLNLNPKDYHIVMINAQHLIDPDEITGYEDVITLTPLITDQSQMGYRYARADMAIVRGGTTTLAECKLFDLPLVIVPLPVTHDQATNAQFYVENYQDICISQNDVDFVSLLSTYIAKTQPKDTIFNLSKTKQQIQKAKKIILDVMLSL